MFTTHGKGILPIDHFVLWIEMLCSHIKTKKLKVLSFDLILVSLKLYLKRSTIFDLGA